MDLDLERNEKFIKSWGLEMNSYCEEFTNYLKALDRFDSKAEEIDVILYEIHKSSNGKIIKKIPVLNSNKSRKKKKIILENKGKEDKPKSSQEGESKGEKRKKTTFKEIRTRIFILMGVVFFFIILLYFLSQLAEHDPFDLHFIAVNSNLINQYYSELYLDKLNISSSVIE